MQSNDEDKSDIPFKSARQLLAEENRPWYQWFSKYDTPAERKLILKLDLLIVGYGFVLYWIRYIDSSNINNAYVSGMSTELGFHGNQLTQFQTMWTISSAIFNLPFIYFFPRVRMNLLMPTLDILWGIFTLVQYRAKTFGQIMAFRFIIGALEAPFMTGFYWVAGSWYRGDELGRRAGSFYLGLSLGGMTAGLVQAAILKSLDGAHGLAAWRWMFIINGVMTIPIGIAGYFIWPGTPDKCWSLFISKEEVDLAKARLIRFGNKVEVEPLNWKLVKQIAKSWRPYALTLWVTLFFNCSPLGSAYILWLKSIFPTDLVKVNQLSTTASGLGMFFVVVINFGADFFKSLPGAVFTSNAILLVANIILCTGTMNRSARFAAYNLLPAAAGQSACIYSFTNYILRRNPQERAFTIAVMTVVGGLTSAFIPLGTYPTSKSPRFKTGFIYSVTITVLQLIYTVFIGWMSKREDARHDADDLRRAIDQLGAEASLKNIRSEPGKADDQKDGSTEEQWPVGTQLPAIPKDAHRSVIRVP